MLIQWKECDRRVSHYVLTQASDQPLLGTLTIDGEEVAIPLAWCISLEKAVSICGDILRTCDLSAPEGLTWQMIESEK